MKTKLLTLILSFNVLADTNQNSYVYYLDKKVYNNSIKVLKENNNEIEQPTETVSPICGASNNGSFNTTPSQLCNVGTASSVTENTNSYNWSCSNDNITLNCSASLISTPVCGSADGVGVDLKPAENLCEKGNPSSVITSNGSHTWTCESGEETESCNANQIINTAKHSSCKAMLEEYPQLSGQDGVYPATVGVLNSSLYCNMTYQGGGWTLVSAQFENDVANWNEGIQADYNPSLSTSKGFSLNNSQLPLHTQISIGYQHNIINYFNYIYNTGNINLSNILGLSDNKMYQIHRSTDHFYNWHDPERGIVTSGLSSHVVWRNTFLIHPLNDTTSFYFAFSPNAANKYEKGFSNNLSNLSTTNENYSWSIFVR